MRVRTPQPKKVAPARVNVRQRGSPSVVQWPGVFGDAEAWETVQEIDLIGTLEMVTKPRIEPLRTITEKDTRLYVNDRAVYDILDGIFEEIELPVTRNVVDYEVAWEAVKDDIFYDVREFSSVSLRSLCLFETNDVLVYANESRAEQELAKIIEGIALPICENKVKEDTVFVDEEDLEQWCALPFDLNEGSMDMLRQFQRKDLQLWVNNRCADAIIDDIYEQIEFPLESNLDLNSDVIERITENDDYDDLSPFARLELISLIEFTRKTTFDPVFADKLLLDIVSDVLDDLPLIPNEQIHTQNNFDQTLSSLKRYCRKPSSPLRDHKNLCTATSQTEPANEDLPDELNGMTYRVDKATLMEIIEDEVGTSVDELASLETDALKRYHIKDIQFHVSNKKAEDVIDGILCEIDLPLERDKDFMTSFIVDEFKDVIVTVSSIDLSFLQQFRPRKLPEGVRNEPVSRPQTPITTTSDVPLSFNKTCSCTVDVNFYNFSSNYSRPLQECEEEQPQESEEEQISNEDVDDLINRILTIEVLPFLPLTNRVFDETDTTSDVAAVFMKDAFPGLEDLIHLSTIPIEQCQPSEVCFNISTDDIIDHLLWNDVFPFIPVIPRRRRFHDIRDTINDIVLDNYGNKALPPDDSSDSDDTDYPFLMTDKSNRNSYR